MKLKNLLFNTKTLKILMGISGRMNLSTLFFRNKRNVSWATCAKKIKSLEKYGMVKTKKVGRDRIVELTGKGKKLVETFKKILDEYE